MATSFPSGLDSFVNPSASDALDSGVVPHAAQHANVNDAVEALEAKVGVDGSAVATSLDYKLNAIGTWTNFTPSWATGLTIGSATVEAKHMTINDITFVYVDVAFAADTAITGDVRMNLPVADPNAHNGAASLRGVAIDASLGSFFPLVGLATSTTAIRIRALSASVTYAEDTAFSATVPFTWTTSDRLTFTLQYRNA